MPRRLRALGTELSRIVALFAVSVALLMASDAALVRKGEPHLYAVENAQDFVLSSERGFSDPRAPHINFLRTWRSSSWLFLTTEYGVVVYRFSATGDLVLGNALGVEHARRWVAALGQQEPAADIGAELEPGVFEDLSFGPARVHWPATAMRSLALALAMGGIVFLVRLLGRIRSTSLHNVEGAT